MLRPCRRWGSVFAEWVEVILSTWLRYYNLMFGVILLAFTAEEESVEQLVEPLAVLLLINNLVVAVYRSSPPFRLVVGSSSILYRTFFIYSSRY